MQVLIAERPEATVIRPGRLSFQQALAAADVVSLHCPATADNHHLLNAERLSWLKADAILINTARGSLIDNQALRCGPATWQAGWCCAGCAGCGTAASQSSVAAG